MQGWGLGGRRGPPLTFLYTRQGHRDAILRPGVLIDQRQVAKLCHFPSV